MKKMFETSSVGVNNNGLIMAIENSEWYQKIDMDYIELNDDYKIRFEYISMDEMNLYLIINLESRKNISKYNEFSISDLKIVDEKGNLIFDQENIFEEQCAKSKSSKIIEHNANNMKLLIYMYTDSFPLSKILNITFSKVKIAKKLESVVISNTDVNFEIEIDEKFINRSYISYKSNNVDIKKAIITKTGFYIILVTNEPQISEVKVIDEKDKVYNCNFSTNNLYNGSNAFEYILVTDFNNTDNKELSIVINERKYALIREN